MGEKINPFLIIDSIRHIKENYIGYLKELLIYYIVVFIITLAISLVSKPLINSTIFSPTSVCCLTIIQYLIILLIGAWLTLVLGEFIRRNAKKFTSSIIDVMKDMLKGDWLTLVGRYFISTIVVYIVSSILMGIPLAIILSTTSGETIHALLTFINSPSTSHINLLQLMTQISQLFQLVYKIILLIGLILYPMIVTWYNMIIYRTLDRKEIGDIIKTIKAGFSIPGWVYGFEYYLIYIVGVLLLFLIAIIFFGTGLVEHQGALGGLIAGSLIILIGLALMPFITAMPMDFMYRVYLKFYKPKLAKANK